MEKLELLPCPFCGGRDIDVDGLVGELCQAAACRDCSAAGPQVDYSDVVFGESYLDELCAERWNQRASLED